MKLELRLHHNSESSLSGTDGNGSKMGRARAMPGGKRILVLCYVKGRPGWSEAVDEGDDHSLKSYLLGRQRTGIS
jgi:hypothetical protein